MHSYIIRTKNKYIYLNTSKHLENEETSTSSRATKNNTQIYYGSPPPWGYVHNAFFFINFFNRLQHKASKPYYAQDRISTQLARSFFLALQHKAFYSLSQGLALISASLTQNAQSLTILDHTDPTLSTLAKFH
jgi:hypothetical protein